jgi:hypothetical protein
MKKYLILAIAVAAGAVLVGCKGKKETGGQTANVETTVMPSQNFVGTWSNSDDDYLEIHVINAEENRIVFVWSNPKVSSRRKEGTAKLEDGKIKFVIQDFGEGTSVEATGTLLFD